MKILYISYDGLTDALGQSQILAYQKEISSFEFEVWILSFEKKNVYEKQGQRVRETCRQHSIHWHPLIYTKNPPILSTLLDISKAWKEICCLQKAINFNIVHCRGYIPALLGEKMKKSFGTKFIFDMRGWWPDEKKESGAWSAPFYLPIYNYFKKKEKDFFQMSDLTISLTEVGKKEIVRNGWKEADKIKVISTCTDLKLFKPLEEDQKLANRLALGFPPFSKILVYSGALGGNYPMKDIFVFINAFLQISDSHYCMILSKDKPDSQYQLPERTILKSVPYTEVSSMLATCDYGMIYYKKAFSNIGRCPTKLGEYWACGIYALSPSQVGDVDALFQNYKGTGGSIEEWKTEAISNVLRNLPVPDRERLTSAAIDYFSLEKGVNFYKSVYKTLA